MVLITYLSLADLSAHDEFDIEIPFLDKAAHFVFYLVATTLACLFVRERTKGSIPLVKTMVYTGIFMFIYGTIIEVLQYAVTTVRSGEISDFFANSVGVILSLFMVYYLFSGETRLKWKQ